MLQYLVEALIFYDEFTSRN